MYKFGTDKNSGSEIFQAYLHFNLPLLKAETFQTKGGSYFNPTTVGENELVGHVGWWGV